MDPDETLKNARAITRELKFDYEDSEEFHALIDDFVEAFESLDQWLSEGGFLPEAWQHD